jgi:multimeric flavodoxin WrbA
MKKSNKRILILFASPKKKGNTANLVRWFVEGARSKGAKIKVVDLSSLKYKVNGCTSCMGCQRSKEYRCVIDDEASSIIAGIADVDVAVFATPVYFFGPTAQLKLFLDRMFSLSKFDRKTGSVKTILENQAFVVIASAAGPFEPGLRLLEETFKSISRFSRMKFDSLLVPRAGGSGEIRNNTEIRNKVVAFGKKIAL